MNVTTLIRGACLTAVLTLASAWAETTPPVFTTPLSGAPNPAAVAQNVTFTAVASSSKPLTYLWDFGDGRGDTTSNGSIVHQYSDPGTFTVTVTVTDGSSNTSSTTTETVIATPPVITSPLTGVPNPAGTAQKITFTAVASSSQFLLYNWDFGDGLSDTTFDGSIVHQYPKPGAYTVTVTASDGTLQTTSTTTETVNAPLVLSAEPGDGGIDSDGDGFSDQFEGEAGSDPFDAKSTPAGNLPASSDRIHDLQSVSGKFTLFKSTGTSKGKPKMNSLKMSVKLAAPGGFSAGETILIDVAGIVRSFTLDNKGHGSEGKSTISVSGKSSKKGLSLTRAATSSNATLNVVLVDDEEALAIVISNLWFDLLFRSGIDVNGPNGQQSSKVMIRVTDSRGNVYQDTADAHTIIKSGNATVAVVGEY